ncbi:MAG: tetratricopeptide repeat protein, partial [Saprospiraceae bacterium]
SIALLNSSKISASVGRSVLVGILCIYAFLIYQRREVWSDSIHLWTEAIEREPKGPVPYNNRGASYFEENQTDAALLDFQSAIAISPEYTNALFNLGNAEAKKGLYPQAILHFDKAIALKPNYKNAWRNRGNCKHMLGNDAEACADWNEAKNQGHQGVDRALSLYCH